MQRLAVTLWTRSVPVLKTSKRASSTPTSRYVYDHASPSLLGSNSSFRIPSWSRTWPTLYGLKPRYRHV